MCLIEAWVNCSLFNSLLQTGRELSLVIKWGGGKLFFLCHWIQEDCSTAEEVSVVFFFFFVFVRYNTQKDMSE